MRVMEVEFGGGVKESSFERLGCWGEKVSVARGLGDGERWWRVTVLRGGWAGVIARVGEKRERRVRGMRRKGGKRCIVFRAE